MLNTNDKEIWKDVPDLIGRYQVSNLGRVKSIQDNHGRPKELIRKTHIRSGYEYAQLWYKDQSYHYAVHRLVAEVFIPNPQLKPCVNHIDGDKLNNHIENLEWITYQENNLHARITGLISNTGSETRKGKKWGNTSKYNGVTYDKSRNRYIATIKVKGKTIAKRFTVKKYGDQAEILAAQAVNDLIDEYGLKNRAHNIIS